MQMIPHHDGASPRGELGSRAAAEQKVLAALSAEPLDLLVIGGGIVGAGIARDAAMRGLKIGLIDCHDFAFGTSSRSSRLLHGGIRYLAQGRIGLVREASLEKTILHKIAPHLAEPLAFIFPSYRGSGWPFWQLRMGVKIYDLLCGHTFGRSHSLQRDELIRRADGLTHENLAGAVRYYDAFTQDARLVIDTLSAAAQNGAALANYLRFERAQRQGQYFLCDVVDELSSERFSIQSKCVVNATGPWAQGLGFSQMQLRLTKGIHLVFERKRLPVLDAVVITEGARLLFVIPWGERVIVGTTDTDYAGDTDSVRSEPDDINYLLTAIARFFPEASLAREDIISSWAGLRPLIADSRRGPSEISRTHRIEQPQPGWWDVGGGKLTTYRLMAEQAVDQVVQVLGGRFRACATAETPLLSPSEILGISQIIPPPLSRDLIEHYCTREWAVHLDDVMMRRSGWHYYHRNHSELAHQAAQWMTKQLGWSNGQREGELRRYRVAWDWPLQ